MSANSSVTVITATIGHAGLGRCIESVRSQSYPHVEHLVVVDGPVWWGRVEPVTESMGAERLRVLRLPYATGGNRWHGHRIYGAMPFLVLTDYVCWLDDDNWLDEDHVESLIRAMEPTHAPWAFSLRKIVDQEGNLVALDQCESLGNLHHSFLHPGDFLVDANCYMVRRDLAIQLAGAWNRSARPPTGPPPDRLLFQLLMRHYRQPPSTRRHTVNYRAGSTRDSMTAEFFLSGNEAMRRRYPGGLPWECD